MEIVSVHLALGFLVFDLLVELSQSLVETVEADWMLQVDSCLVLVKSLHKIADDESRVWSRSVQ